MPITLTFADPLNVSLQVGDNAYFLDTSNYTLADSTVIPYGANTNMVDIGNITTVNHANNSITTDIAATATRPTQNVDFIFFSKDAKGNMSSLLGYYAAVKFVNTSNEAAEIFAVNSEIVESSK